MPESIPEVYTPKRFWEFWKSRKPRYRMRSVQHTDIYKDFWTLTEAEEWMMGQGVECLRSNKNKARLGLANAEFCWEVQDLATEKCLKAIRVPAFKPLSIEQAHKQLVRDLGYLLPV